MFYSVYLFLQFLPGLSADSQGHAFYNIFIFAEVCRLAVSSKFTIV